jgi:RNA polymerase sigma factor (sigma-70 family)
MGMQFRKSANDPILKRFLSARDVAEAGRQLAILMADHAEVRVKSIIMARLYSHFNNYERHPDFEDLYSEAKTRLITYLEELKAAPMARPCKDFRGYVAAIAHNVCNDYLRQIYPARTRLYKQVRDLLHAHPDFAIWRVRDENSRNYWSCSFRTWQEVRSTSKATAWLQRFYKDTRAVIETLDQSTDIQLLELDDLITIIFDHVGEPIGVDDLVSVIAEIKGIKDLPAISFDSDEDDLAQTLSDSKIRIDTILEMREPLKTIWENLCRLPRDEFKVYILYARDVRGEDLITLFLASRIVTASQVAELLDLSVGQLQDLLRSRLPLDNERIAKEMGIKVERVYKLRSRAGKRMKKFLSEIRRKV